MSARWPRCPGGGKTCYPSVAKARKYARLSHDRYPDRKMRWYQCSCGSWHLTSDSSTIERTT